MTYGFLTLMIIQYENEYNLRYIIDSCLLTVPYCEGGEKFDFETGKCFPCPKGEYQPNVRDVCYRCPFGTTTSTEATMATSLDGSDVCLGKKGIVEKRFRLTQSNSLILYFMLSR